MRGVRGLCLAWCLAGSITAAAQPAPEKTTGTAGRAAPGSAATLQANLRVFVDCRTGCDGSYIRSELNFVDHVTDRAVADVHVLITTRGTGGGGSEYTLSFIGLGAFEALQDTTRYNTTNDDSDDDIRRGLVRALKIGLLRYLAQTTLRDSMEVTYQPSKRPGAQARAAQTANDPWNFWVFRLRGNFSTDGEESNTAVRASGAASASRVTEAWKMAVNTNYNYRRNRYSFEDEEEEDYVAITRDAWVGGSLVKSIGTHWGAGVRSSYSSSTYTNQDRALRAGPAVEYNYFPYAETTRRQLTFRYSLAVNDFQYREITLYDKLDETLWSHQFAVNLDMRQPWGTLDFEVEASQYLPDTSKNRLALEAYTEVRLFKGFSLNMGANSAYIRDQIYLPAGEATDEEILLRQRQVATSYDYGVFVGFTYSFGSVYNNVVNTRLSGF